MKRTQLAVTALLLATAGIPAHGQTPVKVRAAGFYESYSFDTDAGALQLKGISEIAVPVGIDVRLGTVGDLTVSTGYASVQLTSKDATVLPDQTVSGILDTEARLSLNVIPSKLMILVSGAAPTGIKTVTEDELAIIGALSSDIIGFSAPQLGTGGNVGAGFVGAIPAGRFAIGVGGTYRLPLEYVPVAGRDQELKPGQEFRFRAGLEGPVGRRSYIRIAGVFAMRSKDELNSALQNGVGNRMVGYVSLNQGVGSSTVILYGYNVFRSNPQIEATASGAAVLPRGNLTTAGIRWTFPLAPGTTLGPRAEFRNSLTANSETDDELRKAGSSIRVGVDLRRQMNQQLAIVLQAGGVMGQLMDMNRTAVDFNGYRVALHTVITP